MNQGFMSCQLRVLLNVAQNDQLLKGKQHLSHEKKLGCLGYIGDYTTQLYRDCNKP